MGDASNTNNNYRLAGVNGLKSEIHTLKTDSFQAHKVRARVLATRATAKKNHLFELRVSSESDARLGHRAQEGRGKPSVKREEPGGLDGVRQPTDHARELGLLSRRQLVL